MYVKDIMTKEVITVMEKDTVEECAKLISTNDLGGLPVLDIDRRVKGIVTEGDLIKRASRIDGPPYLEILGGIIYLERYKDFMKDIRKSMGNLVEDIMTKDVVTIGPDEDVEDAATVMVREKIKRLPVVDEEEKLIGIISRKDIMNYLFNEK